jgi:hypothetical protein
MLLIISGLSREILKLEKTNTGSSLCSVKFNGKFGNFEVRATV